MLNELQRHIDSTAFAFRGYNVRNLGRTPELLAHPAYGPTIERHLQQASQICMRKSAAPSTWCDASPDRDEPDLNRYAEAVALVMAVEFAQTHVHGGGEEFLVLEGVFQDEHGDFPAGSYVRNPPQSHHTPVRCWAVRCS